MLEAEKSIVVGVSRGTTWDYVKDIRNWAALFPGCRDCSVINDNHSCWVIKVGAGGLVRTVKVLVHVDRWDGPGRVDFSFQLESEPVQGGGSYTASGSGPYETTITMRLFVEGSGSMAPMWEAMSKPLLPQMAGLFAKRLKHELEQSLGTPAACAAGGNKRKSWFASFIEWIRRFRHRSGRSNNTCAKPARK